MKNGKTGIAVRNFPLAGIQCTTKDRLAFGFMTYEKNGILMRVDGKVQKGNPGFMEIKLVGINKEILNYH